MCENKSVHVLFTLAMMLSLAKIQHETGIYSLKL